MSKYSALIKRASNATAALALTMASLTPAVMLGSSAKAAQITNRSVTMADSTAGDTGVSWTVTVDDSYAGLGWTAQVCDSPLFDDPCVDPDGGTVQNLSGTFGADDGETTSDEITADNPSIVGAFFVRITRGSDTGSVAMSTTEDVTINARVQERLTFCVGADTSANITSRVDCTGSWDQTVDLGVIDSVSDSPVPVAVGTPEGSGNNQTGFFVLATNAFSGANINYFPESELKVFGTTCGVPNNADDQCFNNADGTLATLSGGVENFGMTISDITHEGTSEGATQAVTASNGYGTNYEWNLSGDKIAGATKAVDFDKAVVDFSASVTATTPSGFYSTSANFVATGLF